jgi:DMSO/TMAO reductase YedYZ molybdopterin-dependent catalytic subunit
MHQVGGLRALSKSSQLACGLGPPDACASGAGLSTWSEEYRTGQITLAASCTGGSAAGGPSDIEVTTDIAKMAEWRRRRDRVPQSASDLPPGQYLAHEFPVLSAGPTPRIQPEHWKFTVANEAGEVIRWDWKTFTSLPSETITKDLRCVTRWSKRGTEWKGVSLDVLLTRVGPYDGELTD